MSRPEPRDSLSPPEGQTMTNQEKRRSSKRIAEMIKENPSKFRKMYVEIESDNDSSSSSDSEAPSPIHTQLVIDGDFSLAFKDCLANLAAYVEHPNDILSLMNASPCFKKILPDTRKNSALWSHALPILLEKEHLSNEGALVCRLACNEVKTAVDDALIKIQPSWISDVFEFVDADEITAFLDQINGTTSNPLISAFLKVVAIDVACFERAVDLLTHYGHYFHHVDFGLNFVEASDLLQRRLVQVLTLIPNVKSLCIGIEGCWELQPGQPRQEILPPTLHALTALKVYTFPEAEHGAILPTELFHHLVQMHGKQLTRFVCDHFIFENIPWNEVKTPLANLRHLEISRGWPTIPTEYRMLSNIPGLQIRSLYLSGQEEIPYNRHTLLALNHVRNTLQELRMDSLHSFENDLQEYDPRELKVFPKLKRLTVDAYDWRCGPWFSFQQQFTNLEHLHFQRSGEIGGLPPTPDAHRRNRYFWLFPKLKTITWGNEDEDPQVFTRE